MLRFLSKVIRRNKLHNSKENLVVKRDSFSVMFALMYNITFYELKNVWFVSSSVKTFRINPLCCVNVKL